MIAEGSQRKIADEDVPEVPKQLFDVEATCVALEEQITKFRKTGERNFLARAIFSLHSIEFFRHFVLCCLDEVVKAFDPLILKELLTAIERNWESGEDVVGVNATTATRDITIVALLLCTFYIGAKALSYWFGQLQKYQSRVNMDKVQFGLQSVIHSKFVRMSSGAREKLSTGESIAAMTSHIRSIRDFPSQVSYSTSSFFRFSGSIWLLGSLMGYQIACITLLIVLSLAYLNLSVRKYVRSLMTKRTAANKDRIKLIHEVIHSIRVIKLYAWEKLFLSRIDEARRKELEIFAKEKLFDVVTTFVWMCSPVLITVVSFTYYTLVLGNNKLSLAVAFTTLCIIQRLYQPLNSIPKIITEYSEVSICLSKIQKLLSTEEFSRPAMHKTNHLHVEIQEGWFSWDGQADTLKSISLQIEKGQLVFIIGKVGQGKSSLLSSILGEMHCTRGSHHLNADSVSYVPQRAWIRSDTLRNNILLGREYDRVRYDKIIDLCCLRPDLEQLKSDGIMIGERGVNLSFGQRARVSLARSLYHDGDVFIFDDLLASVDAVVGKKILENVVLNHLRTKTRIIVTNHVSYLSMADKIVIMADGEIIEQGTFEDLKKSTTGHLQAFLQEHKLETPSNSKLPAAAIEPAKPLTSDLEAKPSGEGYEKIFHQDVPLSATMLDLVTIYSPMLFMLFGVLIVGRTVAMMVPEYWLSKWAKQNKGQVTNQFLTTFTGIGLVYSSITLLCTYTSAILFSKIREVYHRRLARSVVNSSISFFDHVSSGKIIKRFAGDMKNIDIDIPWYMEELLNGTLNIAVTAVAILLSAPWFLLILIPLVLICRSVQKYYDKTTVQLSRMDNDAYGPIISHFGEMLDGVSTIRAFGKQDMLRNEYLAILKTKAKHSFAFNICQRWFAARMENLGLLATFITCSLSIALSFGNQGRDEADSSTSVLLIQQCLAVVGYMYWGLRLVSDAPTKMHCIEQVLNYSQLQPERYHGSVDVDTRIWPEKGVIQFNNVIMKYPTSSEPVLKGISFTIQAQEKVAIVGRTGAGKSSLIAALFRMQEIDTEGCITVDNQDIATVSLEALRSSISIIPQDPILITGPLRSSIDPIHEHDESKVWKALELVSMSQKIKQLPNGLNTVIQENASNFSIGERQLLCMARAILRNKKILVIDEATANVDLQTDAFIQKTIRSEFKECTVLTIAHRLNTIRDYDKILVLDQGQVTEFDTPKVLLSKESQFKRMVQHA